MCKGEHPISLSNPEIVPGWLSAKFMPYWPALDPDTASRLLLPASGNHTAKKKLHTIQLRSASNMESLVYSQQAHVPSS